MTRHADLDPQRGRYAATPSQLPWRGWTDVLWRVFAEFTADRITLIAAGVTFYLLLALFPALAAFVSLYGFVADPVTVADQIAFLAGLMPSGGVDLIRTQLESLAEQNNAALSFGFVSGLLIALWSVNNGIKSIFQALNVAYEEKEKRSFIKLTLISFLFTLGAIAIGILFIVGVGVVPAVLAFVGLSGVQETLISVARWPVLIVVSALAISVLYRFGPSREYAQWHWVSWGSVAASLLWLAASILFSWYLSNFANYNATYGSLGAVIGFMMWTWISVVILLAGAELNAEMEHQTSRDTTTGEPQPMGSRGATMADTLGRSRKEGYADRPQAFDASSELTRRPEELRRSGDEASRAQQPDRLGTMLGFAIPAGVIAGIAVKKVLFRRKSSRPLERRAAAAPDDRAKQGPTSGQTAFAVWVHRGRKFLESPEGRQILSLARDAASRGPRR